MRDLCAAPMQPDRFNLYSLPSIGWQDMDISHEVIPVPLNIEPADTESPFPEADYVVITWTLAEWAAMAHVFCGYAEEFPHTKVSERSKEKNKYDIRMYAWAHDWIPYRKGYSAIKPYLKSISTSEKTPPSLTDECWGFYTMVSIGGKRVLLIKSNMHLSTDGPQIPLLQFIDQICKEAQPQLLLTIGTAGAVLDETALGSVIVSNQGVIDFRKHENKENPLNKKVILSDWELQHSAEQGLFSAVESLFCQVEGLPVHGLSPEYPDVTIKPNGPASKLYFKPKESVITTDSFLYGTTTDRYGLKTQGCIVEMDDALVGHACKENNVAFGIVRNASDPVMDGRLPEKMQGNWSGYIYEEVGLFTSFNGALTSWALLATEVCQTAPVTQK